ncbi:MAG TPA: CRISPR-associated protein [Saprospiraceae bacterium]|nr:CRISPR-associated protein [Saprospiraceae bacterium]
MLLNLSNHPSTKWTNEQRKAAIQQYGSIEDMPFPQIPPEATSDDVRILAEEYYIKIRQLDPTAVHLMGEMTFTFALVTKLKAIGINCIASTTNRFVQEKDGKKIVQFQFIQFRDY